MRLIPNLVLTVAALAALSPAQTIRTVAGDSTWQSAYSVGLDSAGNIYTLDWTRGVVYRTDRLGATTIVVGTGQRGYSGDGGPARQAQIRATSLTVTPDGTIYLADEDNQRVRRVSTAGVINTVAGDGRAGFSGDGGQATAARLSGPRHVAVDSAGYLYIAEDTNYRIRRVTPAGIITTIAGTGRGAFNGDGEPPLLTNISPRWLAFGPDGTLYFSDERGIAGDRVRAIRGNAVQTVAGGASNRSTGDGGPATSAGFTSANGIALDGAGNLYVAEYNAGVVRRVAPNGIITTYAGTGRASTTGDGGPAVRADLYFPRGLAVDSAGTLYITTAERVRAVFAAPAPAISSSDAAVPSFLGKAGLTSNMYAEIYGTNLAATTRTWTGADFNGSDAPTSLDGVSVTVNGKPAFIYFISPTQININVPEDATTGPVAIQVRNAQGVSNSGMVNRARVAPALHSVAQFVLDGKPHVVAQAADFSTFIGRPGMLQGVNFRPARPGETVVIYALGCGPTSPATAPGRVNAANATLASPFELRIGGQRADTPFAGMLAGGIGLYQFNVTIPPLADGDHAIELTVDGIPNSQGLVISVSR